MKCLHSMYRDTLASSKRLVIKQNYYKRRLDEGKIDQGEYDTKVERLVKNTVKEMKKVPSVHIKTFFCWKMLMSIIGLQGC